MPEHKDIHICNSREPSLDQKLQISMSLPTPCKLNKNNEMATMAKKHRGFGGKFEIYSFY